MLTSAVSTGENRRLDRWCAAALVVSAALRVVDSSGWFVRRPSNEHLIPYSWAIALVEATVLVAAALSFATARHRGIAAALLVGFSALTVASVLFEFEYRLGIWSTGFRDPGWWLWSSAAVLEVGVGVRALTMTMARPRLQVKLPRVFTAVVVLAVVVAVSATLQFGAGLEPITELLLIGAVGVIPVLALRHADVAVPMLGGLTVSMLLALATRWFAHFLIPHAFRTGFDFEVSVAILPAVVLLGALAIVVHDQTTLTHNAGPSAVASP